MIEPAGESRVAHLPRNINVPSPARGHSVPSTNEEVFLQNGTQVRGCLKWAALNRRHLFGGGVDESRQRSCK